MESRRLRADAPKKRKFSRPLISVALLVQVPPKYGTNYQVPRRRPHDLRVWTSLRAGPAIFSSFLMPTTEQDRDGLRSLHHSFPKPSEVAMDSLVSYEEAADAADRPKNQQPGSAVRNRESPTMDQEVDSMQGPCFVSLGGFQESLRPGQIQATTDPTRSLVYSPDSPRYENLDIDAMLEAGQLEFPDWITDASTPGRGAPRGLLLLPGSGPETNVTAPASTGIPAFEPLLSSSAPARVVTTPVSASQPDLTSPPAAAGSSSAPPGVLREQKTAASPRETDRGAAGRGEHDEDNRQVSPMQRIPASSAWSQNPVSLELNR
jgi:hypothetical protein